jgi:hypothetical protein
MPGSCLQAGGVTLCYILLIFELRHMAAGHCPAQ